MKSKLFSLLAIVAIAITFASCASNVKNIPPGYIGKILTPSGYEKGSRAAGQVEIGEVSNAGTSNSLVLLEASTITIKESFGKNTEKDGEDHRVKTKGDKAKNVTPAPLTVDIYVQVALPTEEQLRDNAFASITPKDDSTQERVKTIQLKDIYNKFVTMTVRGRVRQIFAEYVDADDVMQNYDKINAEIAKAVIEIVASSKAPFQVVSVQLSNVKEDDDILKSQNDQMAAKNKVNEINALGEAIKQNPQYLQMKKYEVLEKIGEKSNNLSIIFSDGGKEPNLLIPNK